MQSEEEVRQVLKAIKRVLKEKGISYAQLAKELSLSLSGVKKALSSSDLSYRRLSEICRIAGISVNDLLSDLDGSSFEDTQFSSEQQDYFVKNIESFHVYWKLVFERLPAEKVRALFELSEKDFFKLLKKFDELGLIDLLPNDKLRLPKVRPIRHFGDGPLIRKLYRDWTNEMMSEVGFPFPPTGARFLFRYLKMKPDTYNELVQAIDEVEKEFVKRAVREWTLYRDGLVDVRWICAAATGSFVRGPALGKRLADF